MMSESSARPKLSVRCVTSPTKINGGCWQPWEVMSLSFEPHLVSNTERGQWHSEEHKQPANPSVFFFTLVVSLSRTTTSTTMVNWRTGPLGNPSSSPSQAFLPQLFTLRSMSVECAQIKKRTRAVDVYSACPVLMWQGARASFASFEMWSVWFWQLCELNVNVSNTKWNRERCVPKLRFWCFVCLFYAEWHPIPHTIPPGLHIVAYTCNSALRKLRKEDGHKAEAS